MNVYRMDYSTIQNHLEKYKEHSIITGGISKEKIREFEEELDVTLPESYK